MLAGKGSSGPDWFNVLGDQAFHIHLGHAIPNAQEVAAGLEGFGEIRLILVFCVLFFYLHPGDDSRAEVMQYGAGPTS